MKDFLECGKCKKKIKVSKEVRANIKGGLTYICSCGGKCK